MSEVSGGFPFKLQDLQYWVVKRKDGTVCKFTLTSAVTKATGTTPTLVKTTPASTPNWSLGAYCDHTPKKPIFATKDGNLRLSIGDAYGTRKEKFHFDLIIDGGDVLDLRTSMGTLGGDQELVEMLAQYCTTFQGPRILQIEWADRREPELDVQFWPALAKYLVGLSQEYEGGIDVLTCCQGGHGRSGTSITALMMCLTKYSPKEAITHLRAMHCPRAIESTFQHEYLSKLGAFLGRPADGKEVEAIKDYKAEFKLLAAKNVDAKRCLGLFGDKPKAES